MMHPVQWHSPSPLWSEALNSSDKRRFRQPTLLRFASDAFMEQLQQTLRSEPSLLKEMVACPETWRDEKAGWADDVEQTEQALKLYQPAHQRFYLVAANLVCQIPGLPDKRVDTASEEKISFVIRRLSPRNAQQPIQPSDPSSYFEYGWSESSGWQRIAVPNRVVAAEARLPMFGMSFTENGRQRRLLAGFVPVAGRETYQATPQTNLLTPPEVPADELTDEDDLADPRLAQYEASVVQGLLGLREAITQQANVSESNETITLEQAREILAFALLDLMTFLEEHLPSVWQAVIDDSPAELNTNEQEVFEKLRSLFSGDHLWDDLLRAVWDQRETILLRGSDELSLPTDDLDDDDNDLQEIGNAIDRLGVENVDNPPPSSLNDCVRTALGDYTPEPPSEEPPAETLPALDPSGNALYVVRCVYERPHCKKESLQAVVSAPSAAFQLASFFDSDAPVRPIRITMPIDTSIEGLRKFPKNVSFLISDELRKQIERVQGITVSQLEEGELGKEPEINLGMIYSLSIPIITICALLLLMIIVQLLNIVFWWLPFFKICFPLNLKVNR